MKTKLLSGTIRFLSKEQSLLMALQKRPRALKRKLTCHSVASEQKKSDYRLNKMRLTERPFQMISIRDWMGQMQSVQQPCASPPYSLYSETRKSQSLSHKRKRQSSHKTITAIQSFGIKLTPMIIKLIRTLLVRFERLIKLNRQQEKNINSGRHQVRRARQNRKQKELKSSLSKL